MQVARFPLGSFQTFDSLQQYTSASSSLAFFKPCLDLDYSGYHKNLIQ